LSRATIVVFFFSSAALLLLDQADLQVAITSKSGIEEVRVKDLANKPRRRKRRKRRSFTESNQIPTAGLQKLTNAREHVCVSLAPDRFPVAAPRSRSFKL